MSGKAARRRAREFALQGIYQWLLSNNSATSIEAHFAQVSGFDKADRELFIELLRGCINNRDALQAGFAPFLSRGVDELSPVEHAILLLSAHELEHRPETPYRVIINEAIELAKAYGGTDGHRFVNGVLDKLAARLRATEVNMPRDNKPA
ncbi:MAG TPA: transcription antitermination factor NusB [Rhodocyclaceae bacterium]|nr:transcription antitermination factor NusB [Zoogloeaceae bacterium]HRD35805.1 transcription antitermination factor NusB [Rhodocyclaceae bacterium]